MSDFRKGKKPDLDKPLTESELPAPRRLELKQLTELFTRFPGLIPADRYDDLSRFLFGEITDLREFKSTVPRKPREDKQSINRAIAAIKRARTEVLECGASGRRSIGIAASENMYDLFNPGWVRKYFAEDDLLPHAIVGQVLGILLNPKNRVSAHYLEQADPRRAALRVIQWIEEHKSDQEREQDEQKSKKFAPTAWKQTEAKDMEPRKWLYGTSFIRSYLSASFGAPGGGKSSKRLVEAIAMATGRTLLGVTPVQRCRVWYWNGEDPQQETERRVIAICMHFEIPQKELVGWLFTDSGRDTPIVLAEQGKDGTRIYEPIVDGLTEAIKENKIDVLIVDPFVSCHRVAENDNGAIDTVAKKFSDVANQTNSSVDIVHHIRKIMGREATVEDGRGAGSLIGAARCIEVLNRMTKDEAKGLGVDEHWRSFCVDDGKGNMAPPQERDWFRFVSVRLGNVTELYPEGDNVGVVDTWVPPKPLADVTAENFESSAREIRKGKWKKDSRANNWVGIPIARGMGLSLNDERGRSRVKRVLGAWMKAGSLEEYEELDDEQRKTKVFVRVSENDDAD